METDGPEKCRVTSIQKLEDALCAGTKDSHKCTLILTEGGSAKTLAVSNTTLFNAVLHFYYKIEQIWAFTLLMAGLSEVRSDYFGIYPLKGKVSNIRNANP